MRKTVITTALILLMTICAFASGCVIDDSPPELRYEKADQVDILVFRCGDVYLTHEKDNLDWLETYGDVPAEISLEDGEFAYVNADITRVKGGSLYLTGNPEFRTVNSFREVTFDDLVNNDELNAYDPEQNSIRGMAYYTGSKGTYCIARYMGTYYVYENSTCTGVYHTKDELDGVILN